MGSLQNSDRSALPTLVYVLRNLSADQARALNRSGLASIQPRPSENCHPVLARMDGWDCHKQTSSQKGAFLSGRSSSVSTSPELDGVQYTLQRSVSLS